ncbi:MAG TPA: hypothetical protein VG756_15775 [Pseudonocardiaceae bacterium]|jgi:hypothetical protein|nr:hypothetical protein [Pseudonocardiaceae bacterium]
MTGPWGDQTEPDRYPDWSYSGLGDIGTPGLSGSPGPSGPGEPPPPQRKSRRTLVLTIISVVVVVAAGFAAWWFAGGPASRQQDSAIATTPASSAPAPSGEDSVAYDVGTCFDEGAGGAPGNVRLDPQPCAGNRAVFVINQVVRNASACDSASGVSYQQHGYEVPDVTAKVTYCASLVVPPQNCFVISGTQPIARAACGSAGDVVRVLAVQSAPDVQAACADQTDPDVWFYQSPASGQYACVSRPPGGSSPAPAPTTSSG